MSTKLFTLLFLGLLGATMSNATCKRCTLAHKKAQEGAVVPQRSKGWRPVSRDVKNRMTPPERRAQRMNNKRKKAVPARIMRKQHVNVVKKQIQELMQKVDYMETLLAQRAHVEPLQKI